MSTNEWDDPENTVYLVMLDNTLAVIFKSWKSANEYAERENIKLLKHGHPEIYWVNLQPVF